MNFTHEFRLSSPLGITAAATQELPKHCNAESAERNRNRLDSWSGNTTYSEAVALSETGWTDAPRLDLLAEQIAPTETRHSYEMQHAVTGAFVDVARYIEGHPENMLEFCDEPAPRSISLGVSLSRSAHVTARQLELAGAVTLAILDTLRTAGIAADLYAFNVVEDKTTTNQHLTIFPIARAHEPADQNQLAFWICHPAALRRLIFGFWDTCPKSFYQSTQQHSGRGCPRPATAAAVGVDYAIDTTPSTEQQAAEEYRRIISEITAIL